MELAIIGGLAALGLLNHERQSRPIAEPVPDEYAFPEDARYIYDPKHAGGRNSMENPRVSMYLATNSYNSPNITNYDYIHSQEAAKSAALNRCAKPLRTDLHASSIPVVRGTVFPKGPVRMGDGHPVAPYFTSGIHTSSRFIFV